MMNEDIDNDILTADDLAKVEEDLNSLHKSVDSQKAANDAVLKELKKINEYNAKSQKQAEQQAAADAEQKRIEDEEQEQANLEAEEQARIDEQIQSEKEQQQQEQQETYTEILADLRTQVELSNELQVVSVVLFGVIAGLLFIKIFVDRLKRL